MLLGQRVTENVNLFYVSLVLDSRTVVDDFFHCRSGETRGLASSPGQIFGK